MSFYYYIFLCVCIVYIYLYIDSTHVFLLFYFILLLFSRFQRTLISYYQLSFIIYFCASVVNGSKNSTAYHFKVSRKATQYYEKHQPFGSFGQCQRNQGLGQRPIRQETQFPLLPLPDDRKWGLGATPLIACYHQLSSHSPYFI